MFQLQAKRFEQKYIVSERKAASIRDFLGGRLSPDEYSVDGTGGYLVCSVYLDNSSRAIYRQTTEGLKNRFKLRARYYHDDAEAPVFLEVKRRENAVVRKSRVAVTREGGDLVLRGQKIGEAHLFEPRDVTEALRVLDAFCRLRDRFLARPCTFVCYRREAFLAPDNHVRVTFDRQLAGQVVETGNSLRIPQEFYWPRMPGVILELKFTDRFPNWMSQLVRDFDLQKVSVPKYVKCADAAGQSGRPRQSSRSMIA